MPGGSNQLTSLGCVLPHTEVVEWFEEVFRALDGIDTVSGVLRKSSGVVASSEYIFVLKMADCGFGAVRFGF